LAAQIILFLHEFGGSRATYMNGDRPMISSLQSWRGSSAVWSCFFGGFLFTGLFLTLLAVEVSATDETVVPISHDNPETLTKIVLRGDEWMPYYGATDPNKPGYMIELAERVFAPMGIEIDFEVIPWNRAIALTARGESHCIVGAVKNDAPDFLYHARPVGIDWVNFYVRGDDEWRYRGVSSLKGRRTGIIAEYAYGNDYLGPYFADPANAPYVVEVFGNYPLIQLITLLRHGRIDAFLENGDVIDFYQSRQPSPEFLKSAGRLGHENPMYFGCSPMLPNTGKFILEALDKGIEVERASGRLRVLLAKYSLKDWLPKLSKLDQSK